MSLIPCQRRLQTLVYSAAGRSLEGGSTYRDWGKGIHLYRREESGSWKLIIDV